LYASVARAVPFDQPGRLMMLYTTEHANGHAYRLRWSYPGIRILRGAAASYESIASFISSGVSVVSTGPPERLTAEYVEPAYFRVLRVAPALGRVSAAGTPGEPAEVVIGHRLWQSRFAGSGGAIGRTVRVNGVTLTVVGVMPPGFRGLSGDADLWLPETLGPILYYREYFTTPQHFLSVVARLRPGVTPASARRELDVVGARVAAETPPQWDEAADRGAMLRPLAEARVDPSSARARWLIFGAALFVLLVASVNVANLLATRLAARERDVAVRLALGCGWARLLRALWAEVLALSLLGLGVGLLVAVWSNAGVGAVMPAALATAANGYRQLGTFADLRLDGAVLLFALAATLASGLLVSLLAFRRTGRMDLVTALRRIGRARGSSSAGGLLVAEVALAVALLAAAALMLQSIARLRGVDPGFRPDHVLSFSVNAQRGDVTSGAGPRLAERLIERLARVPGVEAVTTGQCTPLGPRCARLPLMIDGRGPFTEDRTPIVGWHRVGPDHFAALGIPVLRGRGFTAADRAGRPPVVAINEAAARRFWPGENPIGRRIVLPDTTPGVTPGETAEIVGIVGDALYWPLDAPPGPDVYQPALQFSYPYASVMARVAGDPASYADTFRRAVADVDPDLPIYDVMTLDEKAAQGRSDRRFVAVLLASCAALGLLLGVAGVYAVTASWFDARRRELGIRLALGASPGGLARFVLGAAARRAAGGVTIGLGGAIVAGRLLRGLLFEVGPADPVSLASVALVAMAAALAAAWLPARRAWRVDAVEELRAE
jgi:predicted permease